MKKITFPILLFLGIYAQTFAQKPDTLYFYNLPYQILDTISPRVVDVKMSKDSRAIVDNHIKTLVPANTVLIKFSDTTYTHLKAVNRHLIRIIKKFEDGGIVNKKKLSDTISMFLEQLKYQNVMVVLGSGHKNMIIPLTQREKNNTVAASLIGSALISLATSPALLLNAGNISDRVQRANTTLYCLVLNKDEKKISYYRSFSKNGMADIPLITELVLAKVVNPYFK